MMSDIYCPFTADTYFHKTSTTFSNIVEIGELASGRNGRKAYGRYMNGALKLVKSPETTEVN